MTAVYSLHTGHLLTDVQYMQMIEHHCLVGLLRTT